MTIDFRGNEQGVTAVSLLPACQKVHLQVIEKVKINTQVRMDISLGNTLKMLWSWEGA